MKRFILQFFQDPKLYQYLVVGGISAVADFSLFLLLRSFFELHYLILATISFFIATMVNYLLCNAFVFNQAHRHSTKTRLALTYMVSGVGLIIHHTCLFLAFEYFMLPIAFSKIGAMGVAFGWNFLSRKHLVFKAA